MFKFLLAPASWLYKMAVLFRHQLFDWGILHSERFDIPVICIGNITVGGTGKTPLAEMIVDYMSQTHRVALLSRGYGRRTRGYREVTVSDRYLDVGDEPLQIKRKFPHVCVAVCERRADGIRRIRAEHPEVDLIVMDDGFQHRYVEAKVNVVLVDATRPVQEDRMLPLGTLRDVPGQLHRANYFIVTKCPEEMNALDRRIMRKVLIEAAYQSIYFTRMEAFRPQPVFAEAPADGSARTEVTSVGDRQSGTVRARSQGDLSRGRRTAIRRSSRLPREGPQGAGEAADGASRCDGAHDGEGCREAGGARQGACRDTFQIVLPTDKHFIHRRFGNGFSSKPRKRC